MNTPLERALHVRDTIHNTSALVTQIVDATNTPGGYDPDRGLDIDHIGALEGIDARLGFMHLLEIIAHVNHHEGPYGVLVTDAVPAVEEVLIASITQALIHLDQHGTPN